MFMCMFVFRMKENRKQKKLWSKYIKILYILVIFIILFFHWLPFKHKIERYAYNMIYSDSIPFEKNFYETNKVKDKVISFFVIFFFFFELDTTEKSLR